MTAHDEPQPLLYLDGYGIVPAPPPDPQTCGIHVGTLMDPVCPHCIYRQGVGIAAAAAGITQPDEDDWKEAARHE